MIYISGAKLNISLILRSLYVLLGGYFKGTGHRAQGTGHRAQGTGQWAEGEFPDIRPLISSKWQKNYI